MNDKTYSRSGLLASPVRVAVIALLILALAAAAVFVWRSMQPSAPVIPEPDYWPTDGWKTDIPEAHGFDSAIVAKGLRAIRQEGTKIHSLLIIRDGDVLLDAYFYPYDGSTLHDQASVTKSVMTTLIAIAADQGKLDLDAPILSFFPDREIANLDARKERITVRNLTGNTAGWECIHHPDEPTSRAMHASPDWVQFALDLPMVAEPGTTFAYCSPGMHLLSAILEKATGMNTLDFARLYLFEPLGIHDVAWSTDPQGTPNGHGELYLHPYDMAKLGFLWLHGGAWDGKQIVSHKWVEASSQKQIGTGPEYGDDYGYGWWIARPGANPTFAADGRGGQKVLVFPAMNLVLVTTGGGFDLGDIDDYLLAAIGKTNPLPANPAGVADLQAALIDVAQPPVAQAAPPLPDIAKAISGHAYVFDDNPYRMASLQLDFGQAAEAMVHLTFYGGTADQSGPVGLDGQYRFGQNTDEQGRLFKLGMRGGWTDEQTFVLDYNDVASPNAYMLSLHFDGKQLRLEGPGLDWEGGVSFTGWQE